MTRRRNGVVPALIVVAAFAATQGALNWPTHAEFVAPHKIATSPSSTARFTTAFVSTAQQTQVHAASLIELNDGRIRAFWFGGSREGASDVQVRSAVYDPAASRWSDEQVVVERSRTQRALQRYVKKIGNPVAARAADGSLRLYYVTVSLGGWAGSSITTMTSNDDGVSWDEPRRLITSPFVNLSTLVKGGAFSYTDGTLGLPAYHELIAKFGEVLRVDEAGRVIDKQRIGAARDRGLQPIVVVDDARGADVVMRHAGDEPKRMLFATTVDGGRHWSAPQKTSLANPDSAVAALGLGDGRMAVVLNDQDGGRDTLAMHITSDHGAHWREVYRLEDQRRGDGLSWNKAAFAQRARELVGEVDASAAPHADDYVASAQMPACRDDRCDFEFSYPFLLQARNGDIHLVYTWNRAFIKHVVFNRAWIDERLRLSTGGAP